MIDKKITRRDFLKSGLIGGLAILAMPLYKIFNLRRDVSRKEAKYYKNLAG